MHWMKLPPFSAWRLVSRPKHTDTAKVPNYYISRCQLTTSALRVESSKGGACRLVSGRQSQTIGSFSQTRNNRTRRYTRHHLESIPTIKTYDCFLTADTDQTLTNTWLDRFSTVENSTVEKIPNQYMIGLVATIEGSQRQQTDQEAGRKIASGSQQP